MGDWVPIASLLVAGVAVAIAVLSKAPIVPGTRLVALQDTISDLRKDISANRAALVDCRGELQKAVMEIASLRARIDTLREEIDYWRRKYQLLDAQHKPGGE